MEKSKREVLNNSKDDVDFNEVDYSYVDLTEVLFI